MPYRNIERGVAGSKGISISVDTMTSGFSDTSNTDDTDNDFTTTGGAVDGEWYARKFLAANTGKVQYAQLELEKTGVPAGTIVAMVYSDDGETTSMPDTQIGGDSDAITNTALTASPGTTEEFTWGGNEGQDGDGPDVVADIEYWLVLKTVGYTYNNGVTEVIWLTDANGAVGQNECAKYDSNASPTWTSVGADVGADIRVGSSANFVATTDIGGDSLPNEMELVKVAIKPSVATVYEMSLFTKSTRLRADTEWETTWAAGASASQEIYLGLPNSRYHNGDINNSVYGSIRIQPTMDASAFEIVLTYI